MVNTQLVQLPNGKYVTYFDNVLYSCTSDFDCPILESVCVLADQVSWVNSSSCKMIFKRYICFFFIYIRKSNKKIKFLGACPSYIGRYGKDCKELNASGIIVAVFTLLTLAICLRKQKKKNFTIFLKLIQSSIIKFP